jgi:sarcosine oxidase subunit beta
MSFSEAELRRMADAEVVIIGAGIVGASIAYHLAARGCTGVVILEREPTEVTGSTARSGGGIRHQFATPVNIRLSQMSVAKLRRFADEVGGAAGLRQIGYLFLVDEPQTWAQYQTNVALQRSMGVRVELLSPADVRGIIPGARIDDLRGATFGPDDGICDPHGIAMGYLRAAQQLGVRLMRNQPATAIQRTGSRVTAVATPAVTIACEVAVNAAGCWAGAVGRLAGLGIPVTPQPRSVYVTGPFTGLPHTAPMTIDVGSGFQFRPEMDGFLFAGGANPNEVPGERLEVDWTALDDVIAKGIHRFPVLARAGVDRSKCWAGLYEVTPDHQPILGRHPELDGYVDANGFSGHGIMHAPAVGQLIAEEILDDRAHALDIDELRVARFAGAGLTPERNVY